MMAARPARGARRRVQVAAAQTLHGGQMLKFCRADRALENVKIKFVHPNYLSAVDKIILAIHIPSWLYGQLELCTIRGVHYGRSCIPKYWVV
jgi:hypothetical protein